MKLSGIGESSFLEDLPGIFDNKSRDVSEGIGDDCAVVDLGGPKDILLTTDHLLEGVHFLADTDPLLLGKKSLSASLSDIAAMGGKPRFALLNLFAPPDAEVQFLKECLLGIAKEAREYGVSVVGGDTTSSPGPLGLSVTMVGEVRKGKAILRSGARPGDLVYLTRSVGESLAGLQILGGMALDPLFPERVRDMLVSRHLAPKPECEAGISLGEAGGASACIDISDGLGIDLGRLCKASGVGAELLSDSIPISSELASFTTATKQDSIGMAVSSGEEYALLYTAPAGEAGKLADALSLACGRRPVCIGRITGTDRVSMLMPDGRSVDIRHLGYDHFKEGPVAGETGPVRRLTGL